MASALDVRFDIDKLKRATNSELYGFESWKVFWGAIDPSRVMVAVLRDGDTAATLSHQENVFCIEVEANPDKLREVQRALSTSVAFRQLAANPPFVDAGQPATQLFSDAGRVVGGHLTGDGWAASALSWAGGPAPTAAAPTQLAPDTRPPPAHLPPGYPQPTQAYGPPNSAYPQAYGPPAQPYGPPAPAYHQAYGPPSWPYPQTYGTPAPTLSPALSVAIAAYAKRRYQVLMVPGAPGGVVTMERKATSFNWLLALALLILFGVGALVYLAIWAIWGVHRSYRVTLSVGPNGEVQEIGDALAVFDRDNLRTHRNRLVGFGTLFAAVATMGLATAIAYPLDPATTDKLAVVMSVGIIVFLIPAGLAFLLLRMAQTATQKLRSQIR